MANAQIKTELRQKEEELGNKYTKFSKMFFLLAIIFIIWVGILFLGIIFLSYGYNWAGLSIESWLLLVSIIFVVLIVLEMYFYLHFTSFREKRLALEKPKPEFIDGKLVYIYTSPEGIDGGIFSKTYITIDDHTILRFRYLIIPPEELWGK